MPGCSSSPPLLLPLSASTIHGAKRRPCIEHPQRILCSESAQRILVCNDNPSISWSRFNQLLHVIVADGPIPRVPTHMSLQPIARNSDPPRTPITRVVNLLCTHQAALECQSPSSPPPNDNPPSQVRIYAPKPQPARPRDPEAQRSVSAQSSSTQAAPRPANAPRSPTVRSCSTAQLPPRLSHACCTVWFSTAVTFFRGCVVVCGSALRGKREPEGRPARHF